MTKTKILFVLFFLVGSLCKARSEYMFVFYSDTISFSFNFSKIPIFKGNMVRKSLALYHEELEKAGILEEIVPKARSFQEDLNLNDYHTFKLINQLIDMMMPEESQNRKALLLYCILSKMDYDVMLGRSTTSYGIYVYNDEDIRSKDFVKVSGRWLFRLYPQKSGGAFSHMIEKNRSFGKKTMRFRIRKLPRLKNMIIEEVLIRYNDYRDTQYVKIKVNKTLINMYRDIPEISTEYHFDTPFSKECKETLVPYLKTKTRNLSHVDAVRFLLTFVRTSKPYISDNKQFNSEENTLFCEEFIYYNGGDCEDYSVFFYNVLKETLNLPMIVLRYASHINIGVKVDGKFKHAIKYKNIKYAVCEPTSWDYQDVGESDQFEKNSKPKVIWHSDGTD